MSKITVILGLDVETDVGSWYNTYEGMVQGTPMLLERFAEKGVTGTFFVTGAAAAEHPEVVRAIAAAGHEVGCHSLYHETVGEPLFPIPGVTPLLPEEVEHRLEVATDLVSEALRSEPPLPSPSAARARGEGAGGEAPRPVSFRCPRLFGGTQVVRALENLGYLADASYPLYFYQERLAPYHPSADDWTQPGDLRLLEIPNFADLTIESQDPYGRDRDQWPLFRTESAAALLQHVDNYVGFVRERGVPPVLCFYFHPWEFLPQPESMYLGEGTVVPEPFLLKNCGPYALEQFGLLIEGLRTRGAEFTTCWALAEAY
jgi:peptidoglycan/xylan/chitin deacetylase (PgdA/CDA1 family)